MNGLVQYRQEVWVRAFVAAMSSGKCYSPVVASDCADICLDRFDKQFPQTADTNVAAAVEPSDHKGPSLLDNASLTDRRVDPLAKPPSDNTSQLAICPKCGSDNIVEYIQPPVLFVCKKCSHSWGKQQA
jgi:hypothetical protein